MTPTWLTLVLPAAPWAVVAAVALWRHRRTARAAREREHRDAAFCAAHAIDWNATAPERTP